MVAILRQVLVKSCHNMEAAISSVVSFFRGLSFVFGLLDAEAATNHDRRDVWVIREPSTMVEIVVPRSA